MKSSRDELIDLIERSALHPSSIPQAIELAKVRPSTRDWVSFFNALFVWIGAITFGLAIIFFFAYNWGEFGKFAKFALVEVSLVVSTLLYLVSKRQAVWNQATLILSCILVGALLALFGQTYQTGADTWQLFATWMVFIIPWVVVAKQSLAWCLWLMLGNLAIALFLDTFSVRSFLFFSSEESLLWSLFLYNSFGLSCWQFLSRARLWMRNTWMTRLLAIASGSCITSLVWLAIIDISDSAWASVVVWFCFLGAIYYFYRRLSVDLFMLAGACLSCILVIITFVAHNLQSVDELGYFFILALLVIVLGLISAKWLKAVQQEESRHGE